LFEYFIGFMQSIVKFFYEITADIGFPNYGLAIVLFTIFIKSLLLPLTVKQMRSMQAMKRLSPKLKEVQNKYKEDKGEQQKAIAALYKTEGINPLAGCLPLIVQMPILSGMFYALRNFKYVSHPGFLWIRNLSAVDHFYILPIIAALTAYFSAQQNISGSLSNSNSGSKITLFVMPLFSAVMALHFPAGLALYWIVSNLIQIIQQGLFRVKEV
jgi:YidC/Oxa1 family membrane protein insertase